MAKSPVWRGQRKLSVFAAEFADGARRRVDQADVGELDGGDQDVLQAAIEGRDAAVHAGGFFAGGDQGFLFGLDRPWCERGRAASAGMAAITSRVTSVKRWGTVTRVVLPRSSSSGEAAMKP